jgi:hypothetical protein
LIEFTKYAEEAVVELLDGKDHLCFSKRTGLSVKLDERGVILFYIDEEVYRAYHDPGY